RELADRGCLPRPVDADHEDDVGAREAGDFQWLGDRCEDLFDFFRQDRAKSPFVEALELLSCNRLADPVRRFGPEVRGDQRLLDVIEGRRVERRPAREASEVVSDPFRSLGKSAAQAVEPTHAQTASNWSPSRLTMRARPRSPR